eukprot:IDg4992t1
MNHLRDASIVLLKRSVWPLALGWYVVVNWGFNPSIRYTCCRNLALNCFPLSVRTVFGIPYANAQWRVNALATSNADTVLSGIALTIFVKRSTITRSCV